MGILDALVGCGENAVKTAVSVATHDWSDAADGERVEVEMPDGSTQMGTVHDGKVELD